MAIKNCSKSSETLRDLQGVCLGNASQVYGLQENDSSSFEHNSRKIDAAGIKLFSWKKELLFWKSFWDSRPEWIKNFNCGKNVDRHLLETVVNVATSLPFIAVGLQVPRKTTATRFYAGSLVGVGVASSLYHVSRGEARKTFRFGDYAMIALASLCLNSAIKEDNPRVLMLASALLLPVQPAVVAAVHTGIMEVKFSQRAKTEPNLRKAHNLHKLSTIIGGALFIADDVMTETPYIHAAWHLAAALSLATCSQLLD